MNARLLICSLVAALVMTACAETTPTPPPQAHAPPPPTRVVTLAAIATPTFRVIDVRYVSADGDGLFIRSKPDWEAKVRVWPDGTAVDLLREDGEWCYVRDPSGYIGYMPARYLAKVRPTPIPVRQASIALPPTQSACGGKCAPGVRSICCDGWPSSSTGRGTCSHHDGVCCTCP